MLGVASPDLPSILDRANPRAKRVLDAMGRLHARRRTEHAALNEQVQQHSTAAWPGEGAGLSTTPQGIVASDLFQALLATEANALFAPLEDELVLDEALQRAKACTELLANSPEPVENAALDPVWARRWALAQQRHGARTVDVSYLIASLGVDQLASLSAFSTEYLEGNGSMLDVGLRYYSRAADEIGRRVFEPVAPAYLDIDDQLDALEQAFSRSGRVLVVGPRRSGRSALLRAWMDAAGDDRPVSMDPHEGAQPMEPTPITEPTLVGMGAPRDTVTGEYNLRRARDTWLESHSDALAPDGPLQAVIVLDDDEHERLVRSLPVLADFEVLRLPEREPIHTAMIWLAHTMEDPTRRLPEVLSTLHRVGVAVAASIDPWKFRQLLPAGLRYHLDTEAALRSMTHGPTLRLLDRFYKGKPLGARVERSVLGGMGGESALHALGELDQTLHGPL